MIVRNIAVPAAELGVAAPPPAVVPEPAPTPAPAPRPAAVAKAETPAKAEPEPATTTKPIDRKKTVGLGTEAKKADARKADPKPAEAKKASAKAAEAKKSEPKKNADPARWWVQVAGGANVADLPKAWTALTAKNPALKKRQAWTTPLRFTNRLLTGPFATGAEAQAFVNTLGKDGLSAFSFQSEAGQKVTRLPAK